MQSIGPDDQVEPASLAAFEADVHPARVLLEAGDGVVVDEVGVVAGRRTEDAGEIGAGDLDLAGPGRAAAGRHRDPTAQPAGRVDEPDAHGLGGRRTQVVDQAHLLDHRQGRAADVDRAAAGSLAVGALDDRGAEPRTGQPVREGRTGHAGTTDEYRPHACERRLSVSQLRFRW